MTALAAPVAVGVAIAVFAARPRVESLQVYQVYNDWWHGPRDANGLPVSKMQRCSDIHEWRAPATAQEGALMTAVRNHAMRFAQHMARTYSDPDRARDPDSAQDVDRARVLLYNWNREVQLSTRADPATFYDGAGCLVVNVFDAQGKLAPLGTVLTRMLQALSPYADTQRWFLRVASEELGWPVDVPPPPAARGRRRRRS